MISFSNIKHRALIIASSILTLAACTGDLDTQPTDNTVTLADEFLNNPDAYRQALAGLYSNFTLPGQNDAGSSNISGIDAGSSVFTRTLWYMQELTSDSAIWSYENDPGVGDLQRSIWVDSNEFVLGMWSRMAQTLAFTNNFLRQTQGLTDADVPEITSYRAETRFLRALTYYYFMDLYGKAPFVTEADAVDPNFKPPQAERLALFNYIESEVQDFIDDLPDAGQGEYGRADKGAAWMLLAKIYLNAEVYIGQDRYTECISACNAIIGSSAYSLNPVYANNFTADNDLSSEIIFPFISDGRVSRSFGGMTIILNGEVGSIENNGDQIGVNGFGGALRLKSQTSNLLLDAAAGDRNTVISAGRPINIIDIADQGTGYTHAKFTNVTSDGTPGIDRTFPDTDYPLFRYADVLLMYAEAVERGGTGGSETIALGYINDLRDRANAPNISSADLTLDLILDERAVELLWEGHRRQDLIRFGRFSGGSYNWEWKGNSPTGTAIGAFRDIFPIPARSLGTNPNLIQNTGY
ncbi:RagB/SusD family nutrient uptake outer membrane protein [Sungkyunkwania multivorans]|uniref:RagB/SusD family nutrient uptake outer membrane protein n=1 Tax=Sungkyunkwania multivorans TaxID=1173618 RepID=A0ABW3D170_9FLAO